jgi:holin-like protein
MVNALCILLTCQLAGTALAVAAGWPIPGPVLGLVFLLLILIWRRGPPPDLHVTAQGLLKQLGLLFVPAGVGIVDELHAIRANALAIAVAVPVSTLLALAVTGLLMQLLLRAER